MASTLVTPIPVRPFPPSWDWSLPPALQFTHSQWREGTWPTGTNFGLVLSISSETPKWPSNSKVFYDEEDKSQLQPLAIDYFLPHLGRDLPSSLKE